MRKWIFWGDITSEWECSDFIDFILLYVCAAIRVKCTIPLFSTRRSVEAEEADLVVHPPRNDNE